MNKQTTKRRFFSVPYVLSDADLEYVADHSPDYGHVTPSGEWGGGPTLENVLRGIECAEEAATKAR